MENHKTGRALLVGAIALALLGFFGWFIWGGHQSPLPDEPELPQALTPTNHHSVARTSLPRIVPLPTEEAPAKAAPPTATETNAADFYRKAFALYGALSDEEKKACEDWKVEMEADTAERLCKQVAPILDLMHKAAALTNCDWGTGPMTVDTVGALLPDLSHSRALARTATWSAAHCRADDAAGATDDVLAALQMGHNISQSAMIGFLVDTAIQGMADEFLAQRASRFGDSEVERLLPALNDAQYEQDFYRAIEQEAGLASDLASRIESSASTETNQFVGDMIGAVGAIRQIVELEREYPAVLTQPDTQYQAWLSRLRAVQETNPLVKQHWQVIEAATDRARAMVVQRALLSAGLTVLQAGADALPTYPDPATGLPFQYQETADGFQLQSAFKRNGQPVTMVFRR